MGYEITMNGEVFQTKDNGILMKDGRDASLDFLDDNLDIFDVDIFDRKSPNGLISKDEFKKVLPEVLNGTVEYVPHEDGTYEMDFTYDDPVRGAAFSYLRDRFLTADEHPVGDLVDAYVEMDLISKTEEKALKNAYKNYSGEKMKYAGSLCEDDQKFVSVLKEQQNEQFNDFSSAVDTIPENNGLQQ